MPLAKHPGQGSGCQGCDPDVPMPTIQDRPFLCAGCADYITRAMTANDPVPNSLDVLKQRRAMVAKATPPDPVSVE